MVENSVSRMIDFKRREWWCWVCGYGGGVKLEKENVGN